MGSHMMRVIPLLISVFVLSGFSEAKPPDDPGSQNQIVALDVSGSKQATQILIRGMQTPTFTVFKLKDPDRLVVDLIHAALSDLDLPRRVDNGHIGSIASTEFKQAGNVISRLIIGLKPKARFDARALGSDVLVTVSSPEVLPDRIASPTFDSQISVQVDKAEETTVADSREQVEKPALQNEAAAEVSEKDHRVVQSRGDREKASKVTIQRIAHRSDQAISIFASQQPEAYEILEVYEPFRLVLDIYNASMKHKKHERRLSGQAIERIRAAQHGDKVRVVLDCVEGKKIPYRIRKLKNGLRVEFPKETVQVAQAKPVSERPKAQEANLAPPSKSKPAPMPDPKPKAVEKTVLPPKESHPKTEPALAQVQASKKPLAKLKDLNFKQEADSARVVLDLDGEVQAELTHTDSRSSILEIPDCSMPLLLERTLDISEFNTPLQSLSAYRVISENKIKLVAVTNAELANRLERKEGRLHWVFETKPTKPVAQASSEATKDSFESSQSYLYAPDQVAGYSVQKPDMQAGGGGGKTRFKGRRMSLSFQDADIHNVLRVIADVAKLNIVTSDDVSGKVTVEMKSVPWDQALDIILKTKKLGKVQQGNIIRVAPMAALAEEQRLLQETAAANRQLEPLKVRLIPVNYAQADSIVKQIKDVLSERGTVSVDDRTNVIIVKDVLESLVKAEGLVRSLDSETPQVLIEARIVEANTQFIREMGVQWGGDMTFSAVTGNPTGLAFPNTTKMTGAADDMRTNTDLSGTANPGHFAINLPAAVGAGSGGALGFIFGSAGGAAQLNLRLSALENRGAVKIVSAPKITTLDNHMAKIGQGVSIPISVVSAAGVNTQFVEAKLELQVKPHITQEGSVLLSIKVKKNEPDFSRTGARGDPTILKKEAETQVMVRDGDTTVIGGIYTRKTSETFSGVPFLSRIPVLGFFFRNTKDADDRTELLIFITPRIVNRMQSTVKQS